MANINGLAIRARQILDAGDARTEAEAIAKAIRGAGITYPPDVRRLMREVGRQFARNKHDEARKVRRGAA
jgi:hypothetical protein